VEARRSSSNELLELYLDFFPAIVATMLQSASNNAVAGSPSSTRRDKAKERREIVSSGERHTYTSLRLPISQLFLGLCDDAILRPANNATTCVLENLLRSFFSLSLYNFVETASLRNIATLKIDKEKRIYFFFSSASSWKCFYLCFYCCARTFGELLRKRIETSRALREGLIEAQAATFFSSAVSDQGTYNWWQNFRGN